MYGHVFRPLDFVTVPTLTYSDNLIEICLHLWSFLYEVSSSGLTNRFYEIVARWLKTLFQPIDTVQTFQYLYISDAS